MTISLQHLKDQFHELDKYMDSRNQLTNLIVRSAYQYATSLLEIDELEEFKSEKKLHSSLKEDYLNCSFTKEQILENISAKVSPNCFLLVSRQFDQWDLQRDTSNSDTLFFQDQFSSIIQQVNNYLEALNDLLNHPAFIYSQEKHDEFRLFVTNWKDFGYLHEDINKILLKNGITNPIVLNKPNEWVGNAI